MLIFFQCSRCKSLLSVDCAQSGNPMICPTCRVEIMVPSSSEVAPPPAAPVVVQPIPVYFDEPAASAVASSDVHRPSTASGAKRGRTSRRLRYAVSALVSAILVAGACSANYAWSKWRQRAAPISELASETSAETSAAETYATVENTATSGTDQGPLDPRDLETWQIAPVSARLSLRQIEEEESASEAPAAQRPPVTPEAKRDKPSQVSGKIVVKHRNELSAEELRKQLIWAPEVGLRPPDVPPIIDAYSAEAVISGTEGLCQGPTFILQQRPDLRSLPLRRGRASRLDAHATQELNLLSKELHLLLDNLVAKKGDGSRPATVLLGELMKEQSRGNRPEWLRPEAIPTLLQIMMVDDQPVRMLLVQLLSAIDGRQASFALAQRAVFDLSSEVREAALQALAERPRGEFRQVLVTALRYPWAPAADHAAEALVALDDRDAAPLLVRLLREPDPSEPLVQRNRYFKREIIRLKHVDNCLTCHPPALDASDPVQGAVPGFSIFNVSISQQSTGPGTSPIGGGGGGGATPTGGGGSTGGGGYGGGGGSTSGSSSSGGASTVVSIPVPGKPGQTLRKLVTRPSTTTTTNKQEVPLTIRADITFLRQDFSILQPVVKTEFGQTEPMRFDYLIRLRPLTEKQFREWKSKSDRPAGYDQRAAVLFALRELTGQDRGTTSEAWDQLYPSADFDARVAQLAASLIEAPDNRKDAVIKQLKETKGVVYSQSLAQAIPQLSAKYHQKARSALVERMKRMTVATLRNKLQDDDREIRYAAALACAAKEDKTLVRDLRMLLDDADPSVAEAAEKSIAALGALAAAKESGPGN